jgi:hypothetical protein
MKKRRGYVILLERKSFKPFLRMKKMIMSSFCRGSFSYQGLRVLDSINRPRAIVIYHYRGNGLSRLGCRGGRANEWRNPQLARKLPWFIGLLLKSATMRADIRQRWL